MRTSASQQPEAEFVAVAVPRPRIPSGRDPRAGVFAHLVDENAFADRIRIGLDGFRRERPLSRITIHGSRPIGGPDKPYARAIDGVCLATGNPFQMRYGANRKYPNLYDQVLDLRSDHQPLTVAECNNVAGSLLCAGYVARVTYVEFTTDVSGTTVEYLRDHYTSRATSFNELKDKGDRTFYVGSPQSGWQLKVYDKFNEIVRVEFAFRSPFLRNRGVVEPKDVDALKNLDSGQLVRFCELVASPPQTVLAHIPKPWVRDRLGNWPAHMPQQIWSAWMRGWKVDSAPYLVDSEIQARLRRMHERFIW